MGSNDGSQYCVFPIINYKKAIKKWSKIIGHVIVMQLRITILMKFLLKISNSLFLSFFLFFLFLRVKKKKKNLLARVGWTVNTSIFPSGVCTSRIASVSSIFFSQSFLFSQKPSYYFFFCYSSRTCFFFFCCFFQHLPKCVFKKNI